MKIMGLFFAGLLLLLSDTIFAGPSCNLSSPETDSKILNILNDLQSDNGLNRTNARIALSQQSTSIKMPLIKDLLSLNPENIRCVYGGLFALSLTSKQDRCLYLSENIDLREIVSRYTNHSDPTTRAVAASASFETCGPIFISTCEHNQSLPANEKILESVRENIIKFNSTPIMPNNALSMESRNWIQQSPIGVSIHFFGDIDSKSYQEVLGGFRSMLLTPPLPLSESYRSAVFANPSPTGEAKILVHICSRQ